MKHRRKHRNRFAGQRGQVVRSGVVLPSLCLLYTLLLLCVELLPSLVPSAHAETHTARTVNETCATVSYTSDGNPFSLCPGPYPTGGNCVWWAWEQWHRLGYDLPLTWGNAADWIVDAEQAGLPLGTTPRVAAIAVFPVADGVWAYGPPGHVAFVTRVSPDGSSFDVTYQNYGDPTPMYIGTNYQVSVINQPRYQHGLLRFLYFPVPLDVSRFAQLPGITAQDIAALPVRASTSVSSRPSSSPSLSSSSSSGASSTMTTSLISSTSTEPVTTTDAETLPARLVVPPTTTQQSMHGDFTGTGTNDLLLYNRQEGRLDVLVLTPSLQNALPRSGKQPVYRMDDGGQAVLTSQLVSLSDATTGATGWGSSLTILIGDVTHVGRDEIVLYDTQAGTLQVLTLNAHRAIEQHRVFSGWGTGWQVSMGRFDGHHSGLLLYHPVRTAMPAVSVSGQPSDVTPGVPSPTPSASSNRPTPGVTGTPVGTPPVPLLTETPPPVSTATASPITPVSGTPSPTGTLSGTPTGTGTPSPLLSPTPTTTSSPTPLPTATPTPLPSPTPTSSPTPTPTIAPTATPTPQPSPTPGVTPTSSPSPTPSPIPTPIPISSPTPVPTAPTATPLPSPSPSPSATASATTMVTASQHGQTALFAPALPSTLPDTHRKESQSSPPTQASSNVWFVTFDATGTPRVQRPYTLWNANWEYSIGSLTSASQDDLFLYDRTRGEGHLLVFGSSFQVQHETVMHGLQGNWLLTMGDFIGAGTAQLLLYDPTQGTARMLAFARDGSVQQHQDYSHLGTHELVYTGYFGLPTMSVMLHDPTQGQSLFLSFDHQLALSHESRMQTWGTRWQVLVGSFLLETTTGCTDTPPCSTGETRETAGTHDDLLVLDRQTGQLEPFAISLAHNAHRFDPRVMAFERLGVAPTLQARPVETGVVSLGATLETSIRTEEVY